MAEQMSREDVEVLEKLVDRWTLEEILSSLSYICGEKAEHIAVNWQDTGLAKRWMMYAQQIDGLSAKLTKHKIKNSD